MAGSFAVTCSNVFPHCAFTLDADTMEDNLPLWLAHLRDAHNTGHGVTAGPQTLLDALTLS